METITLSNKALEVIPDPEFKPKSINKPKSPRGELEAIKAEEAIALAQDTFEAKPLDEWRMTKAWWLQASEAEKQDQVYGLAFLNAAKIKNIAQYYSIKEAEVKKYQEQWEMGNAARILKINGHQLRWALTTNIPNAKFFVGMQFAGQVQNPQHEDVKSIDEGNGAITISVLTKDVSKDANTQFIATDDRGVSEVLQ